MVSQLACRHSTEISTLVLCPNLDYTIAQPCAFVLERLGFQHRPFPTAALWCRLRVPQAMALATSLVTVGYGIRFPIPSICYQSTYCRPPRSQPHRRRSENVRCRRGLLVYPPCQRSCEYVAGADAGAEQGARAPAWDQKALILYWVNRGWVSRSLNHCLKLLRQFQDVGRVR